MFIRNRKKKESTAPRHIHIRFDIELLDIEKILQSLVAKKEIKEVYDSDYQENRFNLSVKAVKE